MFRVCCKFFLRILNLFCNRHIVFKAKKYVAGCMLPTFFKLHFRMFRCLKNVYYNCFYYNLRVNYKRKLQASI